MKTTKKLVWMGAALLLAACGDGKVVPVGVSLPGEPAPSAAGGSPASSPVVSPSGSDGITLNIDPTEDLSVLELTQRASLRIRGVNLGDLTAALVDLAEIQVLVDGVEVPLKTEWPSMNLARAEHAYLAARFELPEEAQQVSVRLRLDEWGGYEGATTGWLDSRPVLLRLELSPERLRDRGHAVVHLDLARSFVGTGEERLLLPTFQLRY